MPIERLIAVSGRDAADRDAMARFIERGMRSFVPHQSILMIGSNVPLPEALTQVRAAQANPHRSVLILCGKMINAVTAQVSLGDISRTSVRLERL